MGECARRDAQIAHAGGVGQHHRDRRQCLARPDALVEHVGDRLGRDRAALERLGKRGLERGRAVRVEQAREAGSVGADRRNGSPIS